MPDPSALLGADAVFDTVAASQRFTPCTFGAAPPQQMQLSPTGSLKFGEDLLRAGKHRHHAQTNLLPGRVVALATTM